jgi:carboxypeptidase Taq
MLALVEDLPPQLRDLRDLAERIEVAAQVERLLAWDERVVASPAAATGRAAQRALVARTTHALRTGDGARRTLDAALAWDAAHPEVVAMRRELARAWQVPPALHDRLVAATSAASAAWHVAMAARDASVLAPHLRELLELERERSAAIDPDRTPYEVALDSWEPGADAGEVSSLLEELASQLVPMVREHEPVDTSILDRPLAPEAKLRFERELLAALGFDWERGRIDATERAFCTTIGPGDVRLTTRLHARPGLRNLRSSMHEAGHGIYAQRLQALDLPATLAQPPGLALDESQSRLFERFVGASPAFWQYHFPRLVDAAPDVYCADDEAAFLAAMRAPEVGLRRIDSGDAAYVLHVVLRMRLERAMLDGELDPADLPGAWNELTRELLGLDVPSDDLGCLQDVHWSLGYVGYFPTYALGTAYAAQLLEAARRELPELDSHLAAAGDCAPLLAWLDANVYAQGRVVSSAEAVTCATGAAPSAAPLVRWITRA